MAAFLNPSDVPVAATPSAVASPPQTPLDKINVKKMYEHEGNYYEKSEVDRFDKPGINKELRDKIDNIKKGGLIKVPYDILGPHRPVNIRRKKPRPFGLLPTKRSIYSYKKLIKGLEKADRRPIGSEKRIKRIKKKEIFDPKSINGGKRKTKKRRKRRKSKRRRKTKRKTKRKKKKGKK